MIEQKMFSHTDMDKNDNKAHYLIALVNGVAAGTVRVYPLENKDCWEGGRLAVKREYRIMDVGSRLVSEAVKYVVQKGARHFSAKIQKENLIFFKKLGWMVDGSEFIYRGHPHIRMILPIPIFYEQPRPSGTESRGPELNSKKVVM